MAMKLNFEFDVKKADQLLRTLNEVKKSFGDINRGGSSPTAGVVKGMQASAEQIQRLQESMRMDIGQGSGKGMSDFIRLSEKAFGFQMRSLIDAQAKSMKGFKSEINETIQRMNLLTETIEKLERKKDTQQNKERIRASERRLVTEGARLHEQQQIYSQMQSATAPGGSGAGGPLNHMAMGRYRMMRELGVPRGMARGALALGGAARFAGTAAAGLYTGAQIMATPEELGRQAYTTELTSEAQIMQLTEQTGREALQGNLGVAMVRQIGRSGRMLRGDLEGFEGEAALANTIRGGLSDVATLANRATGGLLGNIGIGTGPFRGFSAETYFRDFRAERAREYQEAEMSRYGRYANEVSQFQFRTGRMMTDYEAFSGSPAAAQEALRSGLAAGVSAQQATPILNMMARFGISGADRGIDQAARLQFGADPKFIQQALRRESLGQTQMGVVDRFGGMLSIAGLVGNTGMVREQISGDIGGYLSRQGGAVGVEDIGGMMGANIGAGVQAGTTVGMTTEAASQIATRSTIQAAERMQGGGSYESMLIREKLREMGLSLPARQRLMELQPGSQAFFQTLSSITGRPIDELRAEFGETIGAFESTLAGMTKMTRKEVKGLVSSGKLKGFTMKQIDQMSDQKLQDLSYRISQAGVAEQAAFRTGEEVFTTPGAGAVVEAGQPRRRDTTDVKINEAQAAFEEQLSKLATDMKVLDMLPGSVRELITSFEEAANEIRNILNITPGNVTTGDVNEALSNIGISEANRPAAPISTPATRNQYMTPMDDTE